MKWCYRKTYKSNFLLAELTNRNFIPKHFHFVKLFTLYVLDILLKQTIEFKVKIMHHHMAKFVI